MNNKLKFIKQIIKNYKIYNNKYKVCLKNLLLYKIITNNISLH